MRGRDIHSRLGTVLFATQPRARIAGQLQERIVTQFGGRSAKGGSWLFDSATAAVLAASELSEIGKQEDWVAVIFTGETQPVGLPSDSLGERAAAVAYSIKRPGIYVCPATFLIAADHLPADYWFSNSAAIRVDSGGAERLHFMRRGPVDDVSFSPVPNSTSSKLVCREARRDRAVSGATSRVVPRYRYRLARVGQILPCRRNRTSPRRGLSRRDLLARHSAMLMSRLADRRSQDGYRVRPGSQTARPRF